MSSLLKKTDKQTAQTSDRHINHVEAWTFCSYKRYLGDDVSASFQIKAHFDYTVAAAAARTTRLISKMKKHTHPKKEK